MFNFLLLTLLSCGPKVGPDPKAECSNEIGYQACDFTLQDQSDQTFHFYDEVHHGNYFIIDIRKGDKYAPNVNDYEEGHISGAHSVALADVLTYEAANNTDNLPVLVVCYTGQTAGHAVMALRLNEIEAYSLKWGMSGWHTDFDVWTANLGDAVNRDGHALNGRHVRRRDVDGHDLQRKIVDALQDRPDKGAAAGYDAKLALNVLCISLAFAASGDDQDLEVAAALQRVFMRGLFRVYINHDIIGCEMGGALKNVIAISAGMAQGLGVGDNTRSAVITRGLAEVTRLGVAMGGREETFAGLAGMGDMIATCISPQSRNHHVGVELGKGRAMQDIIDEMLMVAEGAKSAPAVMALAEKYDVEMPIATEVYQVVSGEASARHAFRGLLRVSAGAESDPG